MKTLYLPQSKHIEPYKQGQLDSLCGLYSAINAIRLAAYPQKPLTKKHAKCLFQAGVSYLNRKEGRLAMIMTEGMSDKRWRKLMRHLVKVANDDFRLKIQITRFKGIPSALEDFVDERLARREIICISLEGRLDHFSIISGMSEKRYVMFDSDRTKWLLKSSIGVIRQIAVGLPVSVIGNSSNAVG